MAMQGVAGSKEVLSRGTSSEPSRCRLEHVEEWRKPKLTEDGRVLPYKGTRNPSEPIAVLGCNRKSNP